MKNSTIINKTPFSGVSKMARTTLDELLKAWPLLIAIITFSVAWGISQTKTEQLIQVTTEHKKKFEALDLDSDRMARIEERQIHGAENDKRLEEGLREAKAEHKQIKNEMRSSFKEIKNILINDNRSVNR